jgi:hypothetical protein
MILAPDDRGHPSVTADRAVASAPVHRRSIMPRHAKQLPARLFLQGLSGLLAIGLLLCPGPQGALAAPDYTSLPQVLRAIDDGARTTLRVGGGKIDVVFADDARGLDRAQVLAWIKRSAQAVATYFGRFPVEEVAILVVSEAGGRVGNATTWGFGGSTIRVNVGRTADRQAFGKDWVLVHEMTHLALPRLPDAQVWALEGSATYIEPIARVQAGHLDPGMVWKAMVRDMPQGLPQAGDRGLDHTHTWGRTYWGGAIFFLLADIEIRRRTDNRAGLQDAMRAINRASGGNGVEWTIERLLEVGDRATGTQVLAQLHARMGDTPSSVDLDAIFTSLGVPTEVGDLPFNDAAPLSGIRTGLMRAPSRACDRNAAAAVNPARR